MAFLKRLRDFMQSQTSNYKILLTRSVVATFLRQMVENFTNIYIVELGATPIQLSVVRAVGAGASAIVSIPAGWLSDVYSLKRIMILGMSLQLISIICYAFAKNWQWIFTAIIFGTLTMTLVFRIQNIIIANSLTDHNRATGFAIRTMLRQVLAIFAPTIGGALVYLSGGISIDGIRPLYFIQLVGFAVISFYVARNLKDTRPMGKAQTNKMIGQFREMLEAGENLGRFALVQALGSITMGMSRPFIFVYVAEIKGANSLTIGYMGTSFIIVSMLLAIPIGNLADTRGRKFIIFITRPFYYLSTLLLIFSPIDTSWMLLLAWGCRGIMMSSNAFNMMNMEMVPAEYRGRWTGFVSLFQNLLRIPSILIGGYIYENFNPALVFIIPLIVDVLVRMPLLNSIPDTLNSEREHFAE
ncbi:MAG: MFS transporter [Candidatus Bathyarchaeota archaeon]|nr:MFS transporter [Candidatus Bathyarchaeota archaeon]MDP7207051.1 MFS transporter [Candidatus Bathyarchaeota archaeon]